MPSTSHTATETYLTAEEVAEKLKVAPRTIRDWATAGQLSYVRLGGAPRGPMRFTPEAVQAFLAANTTPAKQSARKGRR